MLRAHIDDTSTTKKRGTLSKYLMYSVGSESKKDGRGTLPHVARTSTSRGRQMVSFCSRCFISFNKIGRRPIVIARFSVNQQCGEEGDNMRPTLITSTCPFVRSEFHDSGKTTRPDVSAGLLLKPIPRHAPEVSRMMKRMSRNRQVSIPLRREQDVHLESLASL
jgi:hypothetical protein